MKMHKPGRAAYAAILIALTMVAGLRDARAQGPWSGAGRSWNVQGSNGGGTLDSQASGNGQGASTVKRSWKGNKGGTASSTTNHLLNRNSHTLTNSTTATGPRGGKWAGNSTITKTAAGYTNTGTVTGPNGKTGTYDNTGQVSNGSITNNQSYMEPNGQVFTRGTDLQGDGSGGVTKTITEPDGQTRSWTATP